MVIESLKRRGSMVIHSQSIIFLSGLLSGAVIVFFLNLYHDHEVFLIGPQNPLIKGGNQAESPMENVVPNSRKLGRMASLPPKPMITPTNDSESADHHEEAGLDLEQIRIFCMVLTQPANNATKAKAVKDTWGQRCSKLLFISSVEDKELGAIAPPHVQEGRVWIWAKTKGALEYIWKNFGNDFDWFLKADDDTYVIMESVRDLLTNYKATEPLYIGNKMGGDPYNSEGYMYGGAGYILSQRTLERFIKEAVPNETICEPAVTNVRPHYRGDEDVELGRCLNNIGGVKVVIPKDSKGHRRFLPSNPDHHTEANDLPESEGTGQDTAISFHHVEPKDQYFMEYLLYHVKLPA